MKRVNEADLAAVFASWDTWAVLEEWATAGAEAACRALSRDGVSWVTKEGRRTKTFHAYQHYSRWMWTTPWRGDGFSPTGLCGFFIGRPPRAPVLVEGIPDLVLALRANPEGDVGRRLRTDPRWAEVCRAWREGSTAEVLREVSPADSAWEIVRVRSSARTLLHAPNPDAAFVEWASARARELVDSGVAGALAELEVGARGGGHRTAGAGQPGATAGDPSAVDDEEPGASGAHRP